MIPGGFSPSDRPITDHELHSEQVGNGPRVGRKTAARTWITLGVIVLIVAALILLLSYMPGA